MTQAHPTSETTSDEVPKWLNPGVRGIGIASFLADVGHEIPTSLFTSLLISTLGASAAALGLVEGLADGLAGLARLIGGPLADDVARRRRTAIGGCTSTAILSALIGAATAVWQVALLRMAAWASRGLRVPARNELLADMVPASVYGRAYGFERMMDNLGAIGGPLLALGLVTLIGVRTAILLSVIPGLLAALAILYAIRHIPRARSREHIPLRLRVRPILRGKLRQLLILRVTQQLTPSLGLQTATQAALWCYTAYNLAATLASVPAGRSSDKRGAIGVLAVGVALFLVGYVGFAVPSPNLFVLAGGFVAAGVGIGCVETNQHTAVASLAPTDLRGSAFGLLAAVQSFGNIVASAIAGLLWSVWSPVASFVYLSAWALVALLVLLRLALRSSSNHSQSRTLGMC